MRDSAETARHLAARHDPALSPNSLTPPDVRPARPPETARDLAARRERALSPKALTPQDVRPARCQTSDDAQGRNVDCPV